MNLKNIVYLLVGRNTITRAKRVYYKYRSRKKDIECNSSYKVISHGYHTCCGYYDWDPFSHGKLLFYTADRKMSSAEIFTYSFYDEEYKRISTANVVNWQQGSRLRYLNFDRIIFNDFIDDEYCSVEYLNSNRKIHKYPIYDANSEIGISLDFNRLGYLRPGYGYTRKPMKQIGENDCAIRVFSMSDDSEIFSITYGHLIGCIGKNVILQNCYVNHISLSPSGNKFMFFFVEIERNRHMCYLCVCENNKLTCLEKERSASHYTWKNDNELLVTTYDEHHKCGYFLYNLLEKTRVQLLSNSLLYDGHPTYINDYLILSDTYPDKTGHQKLLLINTNTNNIETLAEIYSTIKHIGVCRCDLHPRFLKSVQKACIDADIDGRRKIYIIDIEDKLQ